MVIATSLRGTGGLLLLGGSLGAAAVALTTRAAHVATTITTPVARVEDWVELAITGGAAIAAAWVAFGSLLGLAVVGAARAGARWRVGEAAVRALTPGLVRHLVRAGIGAGVGASLALAPTAATAAPASDPAAVTGTASQTTASINLGWRPTTTPTDATTVPTSSDAADPGSAPGDDTPHTDIPHTNTLNSTAPSGAAPQTPARDDADSQAVTATPTTPQAPASAAMTTAPSSASDPAASGPAASGPAASGPAAQAGSPATAAILADVAPTAAPPAGTAPVSASVTRRASAAIEGTVVVLRGDTLWNIAAQWLGGDPTDAEVLAATVAWHQANRAVIGADPDVILPGQILTAPGTSA